MSPPTISPTHTDPTSRLANEPALPPAPPAHEESPPVGEVSTWQRFHLIGGGGYIPPFARIFGSASTYEAAAPSHQGGQVLAQFGYSVLSRPNVDLRVGLHYSQNFLSTPPNSPNSSSFQYLSLAAFFEGTYLPHRQFGLGAQVRAGYAAVSASSVDAGFPYSAHFSFSEDKGFGLGAAAFITTWNQALRLGVNIDWLPTGVAVDPPNRQTTSNGQRIAFDSPIHVSVPPQWGIFAAVDIFQVIRNFQ